MAQPGGMLDKGLEGLEHNVLTGARERDEVAARVPEGWRVYRLDIEPRGAVVTGG